MKKFHRFLLETLLQLTLLANVFYRDNPEIQFTKNLNLIINNNLNNKDPFLSINNNFLYDKGHLLNNKLENITNNELVLNKSKILYHNNLINQSYRNLIVAPASYLSNQDIKQPSETRLLLNSISLNANTQISKDLEMEIGIQSVIEQSIYDQDIDLGYKKNAFNLDQTSSNEFNTFNGNNKLNVDLKLNKENQKNNNLTILSDLLQNIPEGYKPYLEEDTGELILYLISNDEDGSNKTNQANTTIENSNENIQFLNSTCITEDENSNNSSNSTDAFINDKQIAATVGIFYEQQQQQQQHEPIFLSQNSVNHELDKLKLQTNATILEPINQQYPDDIQSSQFNLGLLNEPFLNDTWINEILATQPQQLTLESQESVLIQPTTIELTNNQSLLNINVNQSILNNELDDSITINNVKYSLNENRFEASFFDDEFLNRLDIFGEKTQIIDGEEISNELLNDSLEKMILNHENASKVKYVDDNNSTTIPSSISVENDLVEFSVNLNNEKFNISNDDSTKNNIYDLTKSLKQEPIIIDHYSNQASNIYDSSLSSSLPQSAAHQGFLHNHTYAANPNSQDNLRSFEELHPYSYKSKLKKMLKNLQVKHTANETSTRQQESKDEILLRDNNINLTLKEIVESNADDFNDMIKNSLFQPDQITLIKDIRRRGKNKIAAQTCRKRKIDSIDYLEKEVENLREIKSLLQAEHTSINRQIQEITDKFDTLYKESLAYNSNAVMSFVENQLKKDSVIQIEKQSKLRSISYGSENEFSFVGSSSGGNNSKDNIETDDDDEDEEEDTESYDEDDDERDDESDSTYEAKSTKKFKTN